METLPVVMNKEGEHAEEVQLPKPEISLSDFIFVMHVRTEAKMTAVVKRGVELEFGSNDRFQLQVENLSHLGVSKSSMNKVRIKCEVVYAEDWERVVTIVDARRSLDTNFGWLINDLDIPQGYIRRGLTADVKVSLNRDLLDKISLEIFIESDGRYFSSDDTLRYLQCFFFSKN